MNDLTPNIPDVVAEVSVLFERYEQALIDLINQKRNGLGAKTKAAPKTTGNVINLMDALKRSLADGKDAAAAPAKTLAKTNATTKGKKPKKRVEGQREMLLPISGGGKRAAKETAKEAPKKAEKPARSTARAKKAG